MTVLRPTGHGRHDQVTARRHALVDLLRERGATAPGALATALQVTVMTIHRDLVELEHQGVIRRQWGSITLQPPQLYAHKIEWRDTEHHPAKRRLAADALSLITAGSTVAVDDSTTVARLVELLAEDPPPRTDLTVVTSSLRNAQALTAVNEAKTDTSHHARLLMVGGEFHRDRDAFHGPTTVRDLSKLRVDLAVVSATSLTAADGARVTDPDVAATTAALLAAAARRVLLVDTSKLDCPAAEHTIGDAVDFEHIIIATNNTRGPIDTSVLEHAEQLGRTGTRVAVLPWQRDRRTAG